MTPRSIRWEREGHDDDDEENSKEDGHADMVNA